MHWSWARDVNGRDRDETETSASRDRDVDNFSRDKTVTRRWYISRPSRDRDAETETRTLSVTTVFTALHGMQTRSRDENSVRLSVCHTRAL